MGGLARLGKRLLIFDRCGGLLAAMRSKVDECRAWERFCREQAARAGSDLQRQGLEASAEYCNAAADDVEQGGLLSQVLSQSARNAPRLTWTPLDGMRRKDAERARKHGLISTRTDLTKRVRAYSKTGGRRFEPCHSCQINQALGSLSSTGMAAQNWLWQPDGNGETSCPVRR
jgi:hypothetical protein